MSQVAMIKTSHEKKFFIYTPYPELKERFYGFPPNCSLFDSYSQNAGFGEVIDAPLGFFNTWHHSLFYSMFMRLTYSKRRTYTPENADLFIIPYDVSSHLTYNYSHGNCQSAPHECPVSWAPLKKYLKQQKSFKKYGGTDHVLLHSLTAPFNPIKCLSMGSRTPIRPISSPGLKPSRSNFLSTSYYNHPPPQNNSEEDYSITSRKFVSLPFPSIFHWHDNIKTLPWTVKPISERPIFASFVGAVAVLLPKHSRVRRAIVSQCEPKRNITNKCMCLHPTYVKKYTKVRKQRSQVGNINQHSDFIRDMMRLHASSVFCFVPPGDDNTRRGLLDVLLSGCIPVLFHPLTLHAQYPFHIGEQVAKDISVFIPLQYFDKNKPKFRILRFLEHIPPDVILEKQRKIARLAPTLQYSKPPVELLKLEELRMQGGTLTETQTQTQESLTWDPPFRDAMDVALDGMFIRIEEQKLLNKKHKYKNMDKQTIEQQTESVHVHVRTEEMWMQMYNTTLI